MTASNIAPDYAAGRRVTASDRSGLAPGGLMTNRPPANVVELGEDEPARCLATGIDSLVLAVDVTWNRRHDGTYWFDELAAVKQEGKSIGRAAPSVLVSELPQPLECEMWSFAVAPWGGGGYEWLLESAEMVWRVGNWIEPGNRPSIMVELRAEFLWTVGVEEAAGYVRRMLAYAGGHVEAVRVSRVDLCCDLLLPAADFALDNLLSGRVCRARKWSVHGEEGVETFTLGRGVVMARLYDKPREIRSKSGKFWMFHIWGFTPEAIAEAPALRVIRCEFQLRREVIAELDVSTFAELVDKLPNLWAYCSRDWLRMVDDRTKHHTHQKLRPWWALVQQSVPEAQQAMPLVRTRAVKATESQLMKQIIGCWLSIRAMDDAEDAADASELSHTAVVASLSALMDEYGAKGGELRERVRERLGRLQRKQRTHRAKLAEREAKGLDAAAARRGGLRRMRDAWRRVLRA